MHLKLYILYCSKPYVNNLSRKHVFFKKHLKNTKSRKGVWEEVCYHLLQSWLSLVDCRTSRNSVIPQVNSVIPQVIRRSENTLCILLLAGSAVGTNWFDAILRLNLCA